MTATATRALGEVMRRMPLIAILRGVAPNEVADVAAVLVEHGVEIIEIPMNSPEPLASIGILADRFGDRQLIGCGTVTTAEELRAAHSVGARLVLHPHGDAELVALAAELGMTSIPWVTSPTEAFAMLRAGAGALKFFPSEIVSPSAVAAMKAVLPPAVLTVAVGGISGENMREFWAAGIDGFGLGSILYRPGWTPAQVRDAIRPLVQLAAELCDGPQRKEE